MREEEARAILASSISATRQKVTVAKAAILKLASTVTLSDRLIDQFLRDIDAVMPEQVVLNPAVDPLATLKKAADSIAWRIAASEAVWELIHANALLPTSPDYNTETIHLAWTTVYQQSGGSSSGWSFPEYVMPIPRSITIPPSRQAYVEYLVNPDLYLAELGIPNLDKGVQDALTEAIACFRQELFTAAAAMLGKATEGAWLQLGAGLIEALHEPDKHHVERQKADLENPAIGISKKIDLVVTLYERQDLYTAVAERSKVSVQELRVAAVWSDTVRDSRNTIHFGVGPSLPNTYEKLAALILGAAPQLRLLYRVLAACGEASGAQQLAEADPAGWAFGDA